MRSILVWEERIASAQPRAPGARVYFPWCWQRPIVLTTTRFSSRLTLHLAFSNPRSTAIAAEKLALAIHATAGQPRISR